MIRNLKYAFFIFVLFAPRYAFAEIPAAFREYLVWGNYDIVVNTLQRVALTMSSTAYKGLFAGIVGISLFVAIMGVVTKGSGGQSWTKTGGTFLLGVVLFFGFMNSSTDIIVYDECSNETSPAIPTPDGIALLLGLESYVRSGFVEMIWTSADVDSYRANAGGWIFTVMEKAFGSGVDYLRYLPENEYVRRSVRQYFLDCVSFELQRPGTELALDDFNSAEDYIPLLEKAGSPAIGTRYFTKAAPSGTTMWCSESFESLNTALTALTDASLPVDSFWDDICAMSGFDGPLSGVECKSRVAEFFNGYITPASAASGPALLLRQGAVTRVLYGITEDSNTESAVRDKTNIKQRMNLQGAGVMANEWIPILKGTIFSVFLSLMPFLCLLIPTTFMPKALSFMFGSFVFLLSWGVCDAILHSMAMDHALNVMRELRFDSLGFESMMKLGTVSQKALYSFGAARFQGMMIAGILASTLARFGGQGISHLAGQVSNSAAASQAANELGSPAAAASEKEGLVNSGSALSVHAQYGPEKLTEASLMQRRISQESHGKIAARHGGAGNAVDDISSGNAAGSFFGAHDSTARDDAYRKMEGEDGIGLQGRLARMHGTEAEQRYGSSEGVREGVRSTGAGSVAGYSRRAASRGVEENSAKMGAQDKVAGELYGGDANKSLNAQAEHSQYQAGHGAKETHELAGRKGVTESDVIREQAQHSVSKGYAGASASGNLAEERGVSRDDMNYQTALAGEKSSLAGAIGQRKHEEETGQSAVDTGALVSQNSQTAGYAGAKAERDVGNREFGGFAQMKASESSLSLGKKVGEMKARGGTPDSVYGSGKASGRTGALRELAGDRVRQTVGDRAFTDAQVTQGMSPVVDDLNQDLRNDLAQGHISDETAQRFNSLPPEARAMFLARGMPTNFNGEEAANAAQALADSGMISQSEVGGYADNLAESAGQLHFHQGDEGGLGVSFSDTRTGSTHSDLDKNVTDHSTSEDYTYSQRSGNRITHEDINTRTEDNTHTKRFATPDGAVNQTLDSDGNVVLSRIEGGRSSHTDDTSTRKYVDNDNYLTTETKGRWGENARVVKETGDSTSIDEDVINYRHGFNGATDIVDNNMFQAVKAGNKAQGYSDDDSVREAANIAARTSGTLEAGRLYGQAFTVKNLATAAAIGAVEFGKGAEPLEMYKTSLFGSGNSNPKIMQDLDQTQSLEGAHSNRKGFETSQSSGTDYNNRRGLRD